MGNERDVEKIEEGRGGGFVAVTSRRGVYETRCNKETRGGAKMRRRRGGVGAKLAASVVVVLCARLKTWNSTGQSLSWTLVVLSFSLPTCRTAR